MSTPTQPNAVFDFRVLRAWLAIAAWTGLILTLAGEEFAAPATEGFLARLLRAILPGISDWTVGAANFAIRKSAHAGIYAVLALLAFRAVRLGVVAAATRQAGLAILVALAVAVADETRQGFTATRGGSIADVCLDLVGAAAAVAMAARLRDTGWGARLFPSAGAGA